jgi:hypothetical protein
MRRTAWWAWSVVLLTAAVVARADDAKPKDSPKDEPPKSAAEQYQALVNEVRTAQQEFYKEYSKAKTNEERQKLYAEKYPKPDDYAKKFLELAKKHPKDPAAVDALVWVSTNAPFGSEGDEATKTLLEDHVTSEKLGPLCGRLVYVPTGEKTLRTILEKNPHKDVQGQACYSLAQLIKGKGDRGDEAALKEAEELFVRVEKDYTDVKLPRGTLGAMAKGELNELRNLSVGKVAPEIEAEDIDGVKFKLSDYRGKVVMLDFWGHW